MMNWKVAFFISFISLLGSLFWGINKPVPEYDCKKCLCDYDKKIEIPANKAKRDTNLYAQFRDTLDIKEKGKPAEDGDNSKGVQTLINQFENLRGFKLAHHELSAMLHDAGCDAEVWAMLCVKPATGTRDVEIDMLFQVQTPGPQEGIFEDRFYDFTQPCPTSCPDN